MRWYPIKTEAFTGNVSINASIKCFLNIKLIRRIKSVDDAFQTLEENMVQISTMKSTRFVEPFAKEVDFWERTLSYIMESLETALVVQRQYLYLEVIYPTTNDDYLIHFLFQNIFMGEDIRKQLPLETDAFDKITWSWLDVTNKMHAGKTALKATTFKDPPYLLNRLNEMNDSLELIQRALEKYLETKRHIFPRFYFISNDDMLEILGNAKKPEAIQPHYKKLFDNLNKLKIQKVICFSIQNKNFLID